jgi:hypothetical protein
MSQAFFRRNLDDLFVKRTCDILIGRKPPLRKPVIYKNITNPPEVVISREIVEKAVLTNRAISRYLQFLKFSLLESMI